MNFNIDAKPVAVGYVLAQGANGRFKPVDPSALTPGGHFSPSANNTYDLGLTGTRWRDLFLGRNAAIGGTLDVTGAATLGSTLALSGAQTTTINDATNGGVTRGHTLSHTTTGPATAGVGAGMLLRAESGAGTLRSAGAVDAIHTDVTDGAEVSELVLSAARGGSLLEAARFGAAASAVNSLYVGASATGQPVEVHLAGADTNCGLAISGKGTGSLSLRSGGGDTRVAVNNTGLGFFGATPAAQPVAVADAAGGATVDAEARTALNALLARLRTLGLIAT